MHTRVCISVKKGNVLVLFISENIHRKLLSLINLIQLIISDSLLTSELPTCWLWSTVKVGFLITGLVCSFFLLFFPLNDNFKN